MTSLLASIFFLFLAVHPFVTYPISLLILSKFWPIPRRDTSANSELPSISICFCAYNEAEVIATKVKNLESVAKKYSRPVEILMYADACSDDTVEIATEHASFTQIVKGGERLGKSAGMNRIVSLATGELVVFTDANVMLDDETLPNLAAAFDDQSIGCACGRLIYTNDEAGDSAYVGSLYWKLEEFVKSRESLTGSTMGADGALFAIRRVLYREVPNDIIDDMFTSMSILCDGYRVVSVPEAYAYEKNATNSGDEFRRKVRIACRSFNCHRHILQRLFRLSWLDLYKYASHKLVRWLTIYTLSAGLLCSVIAALQLGYITYLVVPAVVACFVVLLGVLGVPKFRGFTEIFFAFFAVGLGVWHSVQGRRYQTWLPPQSSR